MNTQQPIGNWIWHPHQQGNEYNLFVWFKRSIIADANLSKAAIFITAECYYRLFVNGKWINDGPCRSWQNHYQYDVIDLKSALVEGENEILVLCRYYGAGSFHRVPKRAGFMADLMLFDQYGYVTDRLFTDESWHCAIDEAWVQSVPKIGLGMEPCEEYNAQQGNTLVFMNAKMIAKPGEGPWKNLNPRDVALLSQQPVYPVGIRDVNVVDSKWQGHTFSAVRLIHPGLIEGDGNTCMAAAVVTLIHCEVEAKLMIKSYPPTEGPTILLNGKIGEENHFTLKKGTNFLLCLLEPWGHHNKEQGVLFEGDVQFNLVNPQNSSAQNPWDFVPLESLRYLEHDGRLP
ncbi:MAG: alpha-L-rhamnosidase N-terminal domain-containing protein [Sumerlaeia bacterium]